MLRWHSVRRKQHQQLQAELSSGAASMLSAPESRRVSRSMSVKAPTAAEYMPLPVVDKPLTLTVSNSHSIDPNEPIAALGGLTPTKEGRVAALRRRSSMVRDKWATKMEFLLAVVGYAVDLGNIWRFPSVCYKHGGGAFLIPYFIMLMVGGLPMFYMELVLGQFHRAGCVSIWRKVCPLFRGIGYGICCICTFIAIFYNAIIAQAVYFAIVSLSKIWDSEVPWAKCGNPWNTPRCSDDLNVTMSRNGTRLSTPSEEYYLYNVLEVQKSSGFDDLGGVKGSMAVCLLAVFTMVYFALWKGPQSSGKIVWVTATAPYVILSILLVRGLLLPGAQNGLYYYITPDFEKLKDPAVWSAAATQIFFSLGPGFGVLLALSSYNDFNNNCYRDAVTTSIINCATSFFSGCVVFSTLGYMSLLTNRPINEVVGEHDASLIFIVYPQALATMDYSCFWSLIFFIMLITLGIDSTFAGIEAFITGFCDESRFLTKNRKWFVLVICIIYYFLSFPAISYGGQFVIPFLDEYGVSLSVLFIVTCEMIAVCWFYGVDQFSKDIRAMLGFYPGIYWRVCWTCSPVFISLIFIMTVYNSSFKPMQMASYTFPWWSVILGWFLRLISVLAIPGFAIIYLLSGTGSLTERFRWAITPQQRRNSATSLAADPTQIIDSSFLDPIHTLTPV
ncbi:CRE-MOD-5 protein [Caenorhabditis remanei]|uniref:CRE-MOD-5 protein n=1 Tax=Caenorhabditis remanei TaxID=31234 RepID=E3MYE7_CAERE|nr:CRE-MOD-5 protein [Caenorhabditis remanei]